MRRLHWWFGSLKFRLSFELPAKIREKNCERRERKVLVRVIAPIHRNFELLAGATCWSERRGKAGVLEVVFGSLLVVEQRWFLRGFGVWIFGCCSIWCVVFRRGFAGKMEKREMGVLGLLVRSWSLPEKWVGFGARKKMGGVMVVFGVFWSWCSAGEERWGGKEVRGLVSPASWVRRSFAGFWGGGSRKTSKQWTL